jgi:hypothetical protein
LALLDCHCPHLLNFSDRGALPFFGPPVFVPSLRPFEAYSHPSLRCFAASALARAKPPCLSIRPLGLIPRTSDRNT